MKGDNKEFNAVRIIFSSNKYSRVLLLILILLLNLLVG